MPKKSEVSSRGSKQPGVRGATPRAWLLGLILTPLSVFWMLKMEMLSGGATRGGGSALGGASYPTAMSLFFHVVFVVFLLVLLQRLIPIRWKHHALTPPELAILYSFMSIGTAVAGVDMLQVLVPMTAYPGWFSTPENEWQRLFLEHLPNWWVVQDTAALEGFYNGDSTLYYWEHLRRWLPVAGTWIGFVGAMLLVTGSLTVLLRRQWVEHERLTYPIIQLPLALMDAKGGLLKSRSFWLGFGLTGAVTLYNGLAYLFPQIPMFIWSTNLSSLLREHPWSAIGFTPIRIFPFVVSITFLIPQELSFSGWFFYWLMKGLRVLGAAAGWRGLPEFPYARYQSFGAYIGICAFALFAGRHHFARVLRQAWHSSRRLSDEPISMRMAVLGVVVGLVILVLFTVRAGMSLWVALVFFALYFILSVGITRIRAELGAPVHDLHFMGPERILVLAAGTRALGKQNLALLSLFYWFNRAYRCHPMPHQLEGLKLAQHERFHPRGMHFVLLIGGIIGAISVWWLLLDAFYREGGLRGIASYAVGAFGREPFARLESWLTYPTVTDVPALVAIGTGLVMTLTMLLLRLRFIWWSLHPLGYALADDYAMNWIWSSVFVGWVLKVFVLRLGGIRIYRAALPFFLGLIMGEFSGGCFWSILALITGQPMYAFKNW